MRRIIHMSASILILAIVIMHTAGCATMLGEMPLSPEAAREMTRKTYDVSYDKLFRSVLNSFQDSSYTITQSDKENGLILANYEQRTGVLADAMFNRKNDRMEASATIRKISDNQQELRLQFRSVSQYGNKLSAMQNETRNVTSPEFYRKCFEDITKEVEKNK